ncbi:F-box domain-containing protein [Mycena sanguinolenta]|uniref:F-box domain-containing protein n=1 Tax=Mycena sanguinolenta TaxID=230812 RepID=A0A8H6XSV1_9AGAR|nr:F-box domain-containing protein [Mycena sanguinolenta]
MTFSLITWFLPLVKSKRLLRPSRISKLFRRLSEDPILPVELWDVVLNLLNNDGLLLAACVCRTWNEIAIGLYMQRHNVNGAPVVLQIPAFLLKPLHISCAVPQIHTLRCSFPVYAIVRHMRSLEGVVAKCPRLMNLSIELGPHLFRIHSSDSPEAVVVILRDLLRTLASRTPGPVFVLENGIIQRFEADDVRRWPLIARVQSLRRSESRDNIHAAMMAHDVDGEPFRLTNPSSRNSVDVRSIRVGSGPLESFTQITFPTTILNLRPTEEVPAEHLSILLSHISLPSLQYLYIDKDSVDAASLSEFQRNHPWTQVRGPPNRITQ